MTEYRKVLRFVQAFLPIVALSGLLMSASAPLARAEDDHAKCQHRIEKAEHRLDEAVRKHGEHSPASRPEPPA